MLRRVAPRAATLASPAAAALAVSAVTGATRRIIVFSQQHQILESNQKSRGSPSNVWIEDWEVERHDLRPEPGAVPTTLMLDKGLELYNFDQLQSPPEVMEAPKHSSYSSRRVYGEKLQFELNDRSQKHSFQSKWWLTRGQALKDGLAFKANQRSTIVLIKSSLKLFHSSQLIGGDVLMTYPVSGGSRKMYSKKGESFPILMDHIKTNSFNSGLYFTPKQLDFFKLSVQQGQVPCVHEIPSGERFPIYNVDQLEDPDLALKTLQRSPVNAPTFLLSGEAILSLDAKKLGKFKSNYWLTGREADLYQWPIKESEKKKGVSFSTQGQSLQVEIYNVEQLTNPEEGFAKAGLYVQ